MSRAAADAFFDIFDMRRLEVGEMAKWSSKFGFDEEVRVIRSDESGTIKGVSFHKRTALPMYFVEYQAADARAAESWFHEDELEAVG